MSWGGQSKRLQMQKSNTKWNHQLFTLWWEYNVSCRRVCPSTDINNNFEQQSLQVIYYVKNILSIIEICLNYYCYPAVDLISWGHSKHRNCLLKKKVLSFHCFTAILSEGYLFMPIHSSALDSPILNVSVLKVIISKIFIWINVCLVTIYR